MSKKQLTIAGAGLFLLAGILYVQFSSPRTSSSTPGDTPAEERNEQEEPERDSPKKNTSGDETDDTSSSSSDSEETKTKKNGTLRVRIAETGNKNTPRVLKLLVYDGKKQEKSIAISLTQKQSGRFNIENLPFGSKKVVVLFQGHPGRVKTVQFMKTGQEIYVEPPTGKVLELRGHIVDILERPIPDVRASLTVHTEQTEYPAHAGSIKFSGWTSELERHGRPNVVESSQKWILHPDGRFESYMRTGGEGTFTLYIPEPYWNNQPVEFEYRGETYRRLLTSVTQPEKNKIILPVHREEIKREEGPEVKLSEEQLTDIRRSLSEASGWIQKLRTGGDIREELGDWFDRTAKQVDGNRAERIKQLKKEILAGAEKYYGGKKTERERVSLEQSLSSKMARAIRIKQGKPMLPEDGKDSEK